MIMSLIKTAEQDAIQELEDENDSFFEEELCSNQDLLKRVDVYYPSSKRNDLNDLVSELLRDDSPSDIIKESKVTPKKQVQLPKVKGCFESLQLEAEVNSEEVLEEFEFSQGRDQSEHQEEAQKQEREESGAPSDSTDDINPDSQSAGERFLRELQEQSSPQTQPSCLDMNFNSHAQYSSDPGESKSLVDLDSTKKSSIFNETGPNETKQTQFSKNDQLNLNKTIEEVDSTISNFEIIRSNKNFNQTSANSANHKKKGNGKGDKKTRSKAVGPQSAIQSNQKVVSADQSTRLNTFMRNMISFKDDKSAGRGVEETKKDQDLKHQQSFDFKKGAINSQKSYKQVEQPKEEQKAQYVKKTIPQDGNLTKNQSTIVPKRVDTTSSLNQVKLDDSKSLNLLKPQSEFIPTQRQLSHPHAKSIDTKLDKTQSQGVAPRFEGFINQRDNLNTSDIQANKTTSALPNNNNPMFREKKKKPQPNKTKSKNKQHYAVIQQNTNKNQKKVAPQYAQQIIPQVQPQIPYIDQQMSQINPYYFNQVQPMANQFLIQPEMQQPMMGFVQPGFNNGLFQDNQGGIQYLQQLLQQALLQQHQTQTFPQDASSFQNPYHDEVDYEVQDERTEQFFSKMDAQIENLAKNIDKKLQSVMKERESAIKVIEDMVKEHYNQHSSRNSQFVSVRMYGSMATKLAIEQSDVDLTVLGLNFQGQRELQIDEMKSFCQLLDQFLTSKHTIQFIDSASVPVIKLQIDLSKIAKSIQRSEKHYHGVNAPQREIEESMRYLGVDITFEDSYKHQQALLEGNLQTANPGIQCISYIQELCKNQADLKPIVLVLKKLLQNHDLNHPYHGGLNSYSLVLITSAFLHRFSGVDSMSKNLLEFLRYFGFFFDTDTTIVENQDFIKVHTILSDPMTVIDPLCKGNNTTRSSFRIKEIQEIFKRAYQLLMSKLTDFENTQEEVDVIQLLMSKEYDYAINRNDYH